MKKLVLLVAVIASVSMFSCTNNGTTSGSATNDSDSVAAPAPTEQVDTTNKAATQDTTAKTEDAAKADANKDAAKATDAKATDAKADSTAKK